MFNFKKKKSHETIFDAIFAKTKTSSKINFSGMPPEPIISLFSCTDDMLFEVMSKTEGLRYEEIHKIAVKAFLVNCKNC